MSADQIFNLSLTRTATRTLLARSGSGVIGIGRVKTPTLAIVCLREIEIRDFRIEDYFEIVATAKVENGTFFMRHAPPAKARIRDRAVAEVIARAAAGHTGPLTVSVEHRRQAPPRLFDLPSLQKACGQRWGWTADKTLAIAQELYDGEGKKLITYPRAEGPPHRVKVSGLRDQSALDHGLGQLFDEQRHAIGAIDDLIGNLTGQRLAAGHPHDHLGALPGRQAVETEQGHLRAAEPRGRELRAEGEDHQDPQGGGPVDEQIQRLMAATTKTTVVVIPVVTMSSSQPRSSIAIVPRPITTAMPGPVTGKIKR